MKLKPIKTTNGDIYTGDCVKIMNALPAKSVDLIIGSPPYENARLYLENGKDLGIALDTEAWVKWMIEVFRASLRICKGIVAYVVGHGREGPTQWTGGPALLMADLIRAGICLRNPGIDIYKRNGIPGSGGPDWFRADYEWIISATDGPMRLDWSDNTATGKPWKFKMGGKYSHRREDGKRVIEKVQTSGYDKNGDAVTKRTKRVQPDLANPGNVIDCGAVGGGHMGSNIAHENEAPFPAKVPNTYIRSFCPPGGIVLDPFAGSFTTPAEAIKTGRKFIAIDMRESQIKLGLRRIKQAESQIGFGLLK